MNFPDWLHQKLNQRGWDQAELVRHSGITSSQISRILSGARKPGPDACRALVRALRVSEQEVFSHAGLISPLTERDEQINEIVEVMMALPAEEREFILEVARVRLNRQQHGKLRK
jgi:transcriptional regulator with XRE-family HTH domain